MRSIGFVYLVLVAAIVVLLVPISSVGIFGSANGEIID